MSSMQLVASCVRASHALQEHLSILFCLLSQKGKHIIKALTSQDGFCVTFQEFGGVVISFDLCECIYKIVRIPQACTILPKLR